MENDLEMYDVSLHLEGEANTYGRNTIPLNADHSKSHNITNETYLDTNKTIVATCLTKRKHGPAEKTLPKGFEQIPVENEQATSSQRECLTDAQAEELKLVSFCSNCKQYFKIARNNVTHKACKKHHNAPCRKFKLQCAGCSRSTKRKNLNITRSTPGSNAAIKRSNDYKKEAERFANDAKFRQQRRIQQQHYTYEQRKRALQLYECYFAQNGLEYGQCSECLIVNPLLIEFDHSIELMEEDSKISSVCEIHSLGGKWEELKKTKPLCVTCHSRKTFASKELIFICTDAIQKRNKCNELIQQGKRGGCVCCKLSNPCPERGLGYWYFHLDHINNSLKSDWFKKFNEFSAFSTSCSIEQLQEEIIKCQTLCKECHTLKTYLEHETWHTLTKHNWLWKTRPDFIPWFRTVYSNQPELLAVCDSARSKTEDFVPIISNAPVRSYKRRPKVE